MAYEDLIKHLRCPADRSELEHYPQAVLVCKRCDRAYPIRDGIPVMLIDDEVQQEGTALLAQAKTGQPDEEAEDTDADADEVEE